MGKQMNIKLIPIKELKFADYNPRTITAEEFDGLKHSIQTFGFVEPIVINKDCTIIGGHQRVRAGDALGIKEIPCNIVDLDKTQEKKLNVILNSQAISGSYDELKLAEILEELKLEENYNSLRLDVLEPLYLDYPKETGEVLSGEVDQSELEGKRSISFSFSDDNIYFKILEDIQFLLDKKNLSSREDLLAELINNAKA